MEDSKRIKGIVSVLALLAITLATLTWCFWPRKIELTDGTYDIAVALYRVCNQRDVEGLESVQEKLDELSASAGPDHPSIGRMQSIIREAESGEWKSAMKFTRTALDEQTREL